MITIQIDPNLHSKSVKELAGALVLALLGELEEETPEAAFGPVGFIPQPPEPAAAPVGPVSTLGPHLVIPNPPPPASIAPIATPGTTVASPTAGIPSPPTTVQLDSKGFPWDARIHARPKSFNKDGTWRSKRNVDVALIAGVEAELRKLMAIPAPIPPLAPGAIIPPPPPASATPAPAATPDMQAEYVALVMQVAALVGSNRLSNEQLSRCFQAVGITQMQDLGIRLDLLPTLRNMINGIVAGQSA